MSENRPDVNRQMEAGSGQDLHETIPTGEGNTNCENMNQPRIRRKSDERRTVGIGVRITPSIKSFLTEIARQENASPNSVINWLIEVEAQKRGL